MDLETIRAAIIGWEDFRALSGWAGLVSVVIVLAITERMRRVFATQTDLAKEKKDRETADEHRDAEMRRQAELVQQYIGKIDLLRDRMEEQDRARERETAKLREEVRTGFASLRAMLEGNHHGRD